MKRSIWIVMLLALMLPAVACKAVTGGFSPTPTAYVVPQPTVPFEAPTTAIQPTETAALENTEAVPTEVPAAPTEEPTYLPLVPTATTGASGQAIIDSIVLAHDTQGADKSPVNPGTVFSTKDVIHAVVHLTDAPANTKVTAAWFVVDVGGAAAPNTQIDTKDVSTDGTRYVDFTLAPVSAWPAGSYKVVISLNDQNFKTLQYTVQ